MSSEEAFLADIAENPDDDAPRFVFADWLDDQGRGEQAEFIRLQCELARLDPGEPRLPLLRGREQYLLARHGKGWAGRWLRRRLPAVSGGPAWTFRRGVVESVALTAQTMGFLGEELFARLPIRHVRFTNLEHLDELTDLPQLERLEGLDLDGFLEDHQGARVRFFRAGCFPRLRRLSVVTTRMPASCWQAVSAGLSRGQLHELKVVFSWPAAGWPRRSLRLDEMLSSTVVHARRLEIGGHFVSPHVLADLCAMPRPEFLQELTLLPPHVALSPRPEEQRPTGVLPSIFGGLFRRQGEGVSLALTKLLTGLTYLRFHGCRNTGPMSLAEFLALPALADLRTLELERGMAPQGLPLSSLLPASLGRLTTLSVPSMRLGDEGLAALAVSPHAANLHTLDVASSHLTQDAVPILVDSPPLANLRWLTLRGNPLGDGIRFLIDSDLLERLVWLDLRGTQFEDSHAVRLLGRAKSLRHLARLDLRRNWLSDAVRRRLRETFGPTVCYNG